MVVGGRLHAFITQNHSAGVSDFPLHLVHGFGVAAQLAGKIVVARNRGIGKIGEHICVDFFNRSLS